MSLLARTLRTPRYIILFVSDACWMRCSHCWYHEGWKSAHHRRDPLSFHEMERLARSVSSIRFLSLTGGEAFLREDIVELVYMFCRSTKVSLYDIPTSGYEPEMILEKVVGLLERNPETPFRVGVSLDGPREVHDRIRGVDGGFDRVLQLIGLLREVKRRNPLFDMGIITTISRENQHFVEETAKLVESVYPEGEWQINVTRGDTRIPGVGDFSYKSYQKAHDLIQQRIARGRYGGHGTGEIGRWLSAKNAVRRRIILDQIENRRASLTCAAGSLGCVIFLDGETMPCELLDRSMGNIRDFECDLARLWASDRAGKVRREIVTSGCYCTQECFLTVSLVANPFWWPMIVRERLRLMRSRACL